MQKNSTFARKFVIFYINIAFYAKKEQLERD